MDCGHAFCNGCWQQYLTICIAEGKSRHLTCMQYKCGTICSEEKVLHQQRSRGESLEARPDVGTSSHQRVLLRASSQVKALLADQPGTIGRYETSLLESFIEDNKLVRWCPSVPHCGNAVQVNGELQCEPECSCGHRFCFGCGLEPHSPATCDMWVHASSARNSPSSSCCIRTSGTILCCCQHLVAPVPLNDRWGKWLQKAKDDSETANWMTANTKV